MTDQNLMRQPPSRQSIPVVIMCGGMGTRMREETEYRPKPMVEVGGMPILWHIMKVYSAQGYNNFILCLGYRAHQIKEYFLDLHHISRDFQLDLTTNDATMLSAHNDDFKITFAWTGLETLTGERLLHAAKYIDTDEFMLTYGDGVADINVEALRSFHDERRAQHGIAGTITGIHPKSKYGLVTHDENGIVTKFTEKPRLPDRTNGGFIVLQKEFLTYCKPQQMVEEALIEASNDGKIAMYPHDGFWHSMDTYKDKEDLEALWRTDPKWKIWK